MAQEDVGHTPGPWMFHSAANGSRVAAFNRMGAVIALAKSEHPDTKGRKVANARLIASSPDMLVELRQCEDMLLGAMAHAPRIRELLTARLDAVRAVIAKATTPSA